MWSAVLIISLAGWLIFTLGLALILWRKEHFAKEAMLFLMVGFSGVVVLTPALAAELMAKDTSTIQVILMCMGLFIFATAAMSGFRQLGNFCEKQ